MAEKKHHHHHREDDATRYKRRALASVKRMKIIRKWSFRLLCVIAVIMAILVAVVYSI